MSSNQLNVTAPDTVTVGASGRVSSSSVGGVTLTVTAGKVRVEAAGTEGGGGSGGSSDFMVGTEDWSFISVPPLVVEIGGAVVPPAGQLLVSGSVTVNPGSPVVGRIYQSVPGVVGLGQWQPVVLQAHDASGWGQRPIWEFNVAAGQWQPVPRAVFIDSTGVWIADPG